jgi:acyl-CoA synthetase (AMP-forming)/AMP-acid ligase II
MTSRIPASNHPLAAANEPPADAPALNIADRLRQTAARMPDATAIVVPRRGAGRGNSGRADYDTITFAALDRLVDELARGLVEIGVVPGARLATLIRPGIDFIAVVFAIFRAGAVSVLIDPGMGKRNAIFCLAEAHPEGFIAIPAAQAIRRLLRRTFPKARWNVTVGRRWFWDGPTLFELRRLGAGSGARLPSTGPDDTAAIIFTTGSTGPPKGVHYRHGNFDAQVDEIRDFYGIESGEIDLAAFPLFGLFNAALGATTVIPDMDASRPASVDPRKIIAAVRDWGATQAFGSPAIWNRVGRYCERHGETLPTLKRILSAGAPVPAEVLARMKNCIAPDGDIHTPYGATEALPVASIAASEVLAETSEQTRRGAGVCVGRKFPGVEWKVIRIHDGPLPSIADVEEAPPGEIGELIVQGPVVTREYVTRTDANALAKISDGTNVWHRMGDVGYLDERRRFWFCGRMAHRVQTTIGTMYTIPCEAIFNAHESIYRSALVGVGAVGRQTPVLVAEPLPVHWPPKRAAREKLLAELRELGQAHDHTRPIEHFLLHRSLPVDIRHNAKIFRERLAVWAARRLRGTLS